MTSGHVCESLLQEEGLQHEKVLADTLLDYPAGTGWGFRAYRMTEFGGEAAGTEIPLVSSPEINERATSDSFRQAIGYDPERHFKVGRDMFHPGHGLGFRAKLVMFEQDRVRCLLKAAPMQATSTSKLVLRLYCNSQLLAEADASYGTTLRIGHVMELVAGDHLSIDVAIDGPINHMLSLFRFRMWGGTQCPILHAPQIEPIHWSPDEGHLIASPLPDRNEIDRLARILEGKSMGRVPWGQPGFFRAENQGKRL